MNEMVERVAKAIGDCEFGYVDPVQTPVTWSRSLSAARAAIEAMREPTGAMIDRGWDTLDMDYGLKAVWGAMINAALSDG